MAWELFVNGASVGLVSDLKYLEGRQEKEMFDSFSDEDESAPSEKDPDEVFFEAPSYGLSPNGSYELRNPATKQAMKIEIDTITGTKVHAIVQTEYRLR